MPPHCSQALAAPLQVLVDQYTGSSILEVQTRSCEYSHIFKLDKIRGALLEHIPPLDESTYSRNIGNSAVMMDGQAAQVRYEDVSDPLEI